MRRSSHNKKRIGEALMDEGLLTQDQLNTALEYQKSVGGPFGQVVVKLGFLTHQHLTGFLAKQYSLPIIDLETMVLPINLVKSVPWDLIKRHKILPIHQDGMTLTICTADPTDFAAIEELQYATGKQIDLNLAPLPDITKLIAQIEASGKKKKKPATSPRITAQIAPKTEDDLVNQAHNQSDGRFTAMNFNKAELREALIPLLIKKGVITRAELYDAVAELLLRKGVVEAKDLDNKR